MKTAEVRSAFVEFFVGRDHRHLPGSSLVPHNDPTLLFTNAGMVQFKDIFLGRKSPAYPQAVTVQRCLRAGGKHNDLENVGYTARHHTFFEMLGNFSFGDYFKRQAVRHAWDFVTGELDVPPNGCWSPSTRMTKKPRNAGERKEASTTRALCAWEPQVTSGRWATRGPADRARKSSTTTDRPCPGGAPGSDADEGDRFVEIWNLVFMQYNRNRQGELTPLPKPSVDTGMGLERMAAVLQGVSSNYEIHLFRTLIQAAAEITATNDLDSNSLKVIADHARAAAFLVHDGVFPSNEGRGYVLRRILRRALRHGYDLGVKGAFLYRMIAPLEQAMGSAYPELAESRELTERVLRSEEERFAATLEQGMRYLSRSLAKVANAVIPGEMAFVLYDTYGFPVDLTADIARGRGMSVDMSGYEAAMAEQRERSRASAAYKDVSFSAGAGEPTVAITAAAYVPEVEFTGYERLENRGRVVSIEVNGKVDDQAEEGAKAAVMLDRTPFYAESGGQVGDTGLLTAEGLRFEVHDTQQTKAGRAHIGVVVGGILRAGGEVIAAVDAERRRAIVLNHSATHLMNAALRKVLGKHVAQKGSLVAPDRLRFDFSHFEAVSAAGLERIEDEVNEQIRANRPAETTEMPLDQAIEAGALAMAGENYADQVRVLQLGDYSMELCGGTHVGRTGDIGLFAIVSESSVAAGVRRIEALTGAGAYRWVREMRHRMSRLTGLLKGGMEDAEGKLSALMALAKDLEKNLAQARARLAEGGAAPETPVTRVAGVNLVAMRLDHDADMEAMRGAVDRYRDRFDPAVVVLGAADGSGKARIVAGVSKAVQERVPARDLARAVAEQLGGKGGGRADFAQGGGPKAEALDEALAALRGWLADRLGHGSE